MKFLIPFLGLAMFGVNLGAQNSETQAEVAGITLQDPNLKVELLDTHPDEFFLSHDMDLAGNLFLGAREGVFVYERTQDGGFQERKEIYRFPEDTWVYDLEAFGNDLLILTNTALYQLRQVRSSASPKLDKILWGNPLGHHHQGLHGMEFAPDGRLLIAMGDPHPGVHMDKNRPDHLWLWTWYVGLENRPVPYSGVGAVMSLDLDTFALSTFARGLRNPCGISFDRDWNLFANDNDQEGSTANPCKLVTVPPNSWNGWARGWDASQVPDRLDMIPNVNWTLDVPVGQGYYDHITLGENYKNSLFVANWGSRSVDLYPIYSEGAAFRSEAKVFLKAEGDHRPVSAMPTNDGRLIVSVCYMKGNEASPKCKTDLLLISHRESKPKDNFNHSAQHLVDLLSEPIQIRTKAHREILRQGGTTLQKATDTFANTSPESPAFSSLIFLAAANGDATSVERIGTFAKGNGQSAALAWKAAAAFPNHFSDWSQAMIYSTAAKLDQPKLLAGLIEYLYTSERTISNSIAKLAAHEDAVVRQSMAILLARNASAKQLDSLASGTEDERLSAALATSFRLWEQAEKVTELPQGSTVAIEKRMQLLHPEGPIDLRDLGAPVGTFTMAQWWQDEEVRVANQTDYQRLRKALSDSDERVASTAATGLFFLNDNQLDSQVAAVLAAGKMKLSITAARVRKKDLKQAMQALKGAKLPNGTEIPEAFRGINWDEASTPVGDVVKGKALFTSRGCVACHLAPHDGAGGSIGPSMVGVGKRFAPSYLAASMLVPNQTVSPNFHPNTITMKEGTTYTGFVEPGAEHGKLKLRIITGQLIELLKTNIAKQDASEQSMMPAGLIQTPQEMADMIAYLRDDPSKIQDTSPPPAIVSNESELVYKTFQPTVANSYKFLPTQAKFVRVQILASSKGQPCIDELEIFSGESKENLALQANGARATASSILKGYEYKHRIEFLNDGRYTNAHSWIPATRQGWAQIELPKVQAINQVVFSRDRGGSIRGRTPISFDILLSTNGKTWKSVKRVRPPRQKPAEKIITNQRVALPKPDDAGFVSLFDGKGLENWDFRKGAWKLSDGTISCTGKEKTRNWVIWRGGTPSDFVLRLEFKYGAGNSGVQVRSDDLGNHQVFGYQVEIAPQEKMGLWHHSLLDKKDPAREARHLMATAGQEVTIAKDGKKTVKEVAPGEEIVAHFDEDGWNTMEIIAVGNTLTQKINGVVFSKVTDDDARMSRRKGVIALQDHGKGCQVAFRNIRLKELEAKASNEDQPKSTFPGKPNPAHPNIVLILADDFGWGDTSCNNPDSPIKTPQIDRLAKEGIRFTNAHTPSAVCTPTRYGLLTGRYPWRSYLKKQVLPYYAPALIREGRTTLPSYLKSQGYRTGGFGKWHLGLDWTPIEGNPAKWRSSWSTRDRNEAGKISKGIDHTKPFGNAPTDIGFDTYFGTASNAGRLPFFIQDNRVVGDLKRSKNGMAVDLRLSRDTVDDIYTQKAIEFIANHEKIHPKTPFFVYLPLNAIHGAVKLPQRFEGKTGMTHREDKIFWADQNVGRILDALDEMNLTDETLVIFTTDNGPLNSPVARKNGHQPTGPYRGFKTCAWDGGTRVPFVARWPGKIPSGATSEQLIGLVDMLATFADLCGSPLPSGAGPDSVSQLPLFLQDKEKITPRPAMVTATYRGLLALREGKWKAIFGTKWSGGHTNENYGGLGPDNTMDDPESGQLYNLEQDPKEQEDLWESHPEIVEKLRREMNRIQQLEKSDEFPEN